MKIFSIKTVNQWINDKLIGGFGDINLAISLGGERLLVCDEAVGVRGLFNEPIGFATIAPEGEMSSGQPTIVGLYVLPAYRNQGLEAQLLEDAIKQCRERGFQRVRFDAIYSWEHEAVRQLPAECRSSLDVYEHQLPSPEEMRGIIEEEEEPNGQ